MASRYFLRRKAGICSTCNQAVSPGSAFCPLHREKVRAYEANAVRRARTKVLDHYGGKCSCCGEGEQIFLQVDHINDDGAEHRRTMKDGNINAWLVREGFPPGFQLLCANCNWGKRMLGACPHQGGKPPTSLPAGRGGRHRSARAA